MYDYINGEIASMTPTAVVVEAGGIGYIINISLETFRKIESLTKVKIFVHQYILQNEAPVFYGFFTTQERELFRQLISVSGIGANTARIMLSSNSTQNLATIIATGNTAEIIKTKGIGAKTAERVVLELKQKVLNVLALDGMSASDQLTGDSIDSQTLNEAIEALVVLGFAKNSVTKVARPIYSKSENITAEDLIREALSKL